MPLLNRSPVPESPRVHAVPIMDLSLLTDKPIMVLVHVHYLEIWQDIRCTARTCVGFPRNHLAVTKIEVTRARACESRKVSPRALWNAITQRNRSARSARVREP
jgi:hypothetical protein